MNVQGGGELHLAGYFEPNRGEMDEGMFFDGEDEEIDEDDEDDEVLG